MLSYHTSNLCGSLALTLNSCLIFPDVIADSSITAEDEGATELKDRGSVDDDGVEEEETVQSIGPSEEVGTFIFFIHFQ